MKKFTLPLLPVLFFFTAQVSAQTFASFSDLSVVLKSDSTTRSVLMSSLLEDKAGDLSPIIGSASWMDNGKRLQCRSLISFEYGNLPKVISPDMISNAQLVLVPLQLKDGEQGNEKEALRLTVRRVTSPWNDSTATWSNQPAVNIDDEVTTKITKKKKDQLVKINVTEMVKTMFRTTNYGFMICYGDSTKTPEGSSHWFTSPKYEDDKVRPMLLITYSIMASQLKADEYPALPLTAQDRADLMKMYIRPEPVVVTPPPAPVKEEINNPKGNN
ncbi:MAG: DNRLRE domain-containing protein [Chitinophagaceae bacterium]